MSSCGVVFVAAFHVLKHLSALIVAKMVGGSLEVAREESAEGGDSRDERS